MPKSRQGPASLMMQLPSELLLEVLAKLDYCTLLRCSAVCRGLKAMVDGHTELQYIIELGVDGMVDCSGIALPVASRLNALLDRRRAWMSLDWKERVSVDMPGTCEAYELVGGVFAKTMTAGGGSKHLLGSWLPRRDDPGYQFERNDVGLVTRDFAIDPSQDLIAFLVADYDVPQPFSAHLIHIHLRTISTNDVHPLAAVPIFHHKVPCLVMGASIQIVDDVVGMFMLAEGYSCVMIWSWRTGNLMVRRINTDLPHTFDFAFLSSRAYMLTCRENHGSIVISTFDADAAYSDIACLLLPPTQPGTEILAFTTHSSPFVAHDPPGRLFTTSRESRIHFFGIEYICSKNRSVQFCFFVHNRTLLSYISKMSEIDSQVPWEEWGPQNTRFQKQKSPFHWLRYIHGQRVVFPQMDGIWIYDFNVNTRVSQSMIRRSSDGAIISQSFVVNKPEAIFKPNVFRDAIVTHLPYRLTRRAHQTNFFGFMIDDERLIELQSTAFSDGPMKAILVYIF